MTNVTRSGLLVAALAGAALPAAAQTPPPQTARDRPVAPAPTGTGVIAGRVITLVSGQPTPVRRAAVTVESTTRTRTVRLDADVNGQFKVPNLAPGSYRVVAAKAGFVPMLADPRRAFEPPTAVDVANDRTTSIDLVMQRGAAIEGTILNDAGDPAMNVVVSAQRYVYDTFGRHLAPVQQTRTDDRGRYRLHTLPPGEYYVDAGPDPLDAANRPPTPGGPAPVLAHILYPGSPRPDEARPVAVTVGQEITGIDLKLTRAPVVDVRGVVHDSSGQPARSMSVRIQRVGGPVGEVRGFSNPQTADFQYGAVPPGDYWLMAVARPAPGADLEFAADRLTVGGQPMTSVVVTTSKGATVAGRIEVDGGGAVPPGVQIVAHDSAYVLPPLPGAAAEAPTTRVDGGGTFTFSSLFGPRMIRVDGLPTGWALSRVTLDDADVTDAITDFRGGDRPRAMTVIVTPRTAGVRGVVQDAQGNAAPGARVVVFSTDERQWRSYSRTTRVSEADTSGHYAIDGLLPGTYSIVAVSYVDDQSWTDQTVLRALRVMATTVTLDAGASSSMTLKVR